MAHALQYHDFSGGLNLRDASGELAANESPDMWNVTLDERGSVGKRLGYLKDGTMAAFAANIVNLFYSGVLGQLVVQEGVNVRKRTGLGTFSLVKAFTTAARVTFADFHGKLLMLHPVDGLFSYDGTTVSGRLGTHVGVDIATFQNRVWTATGTALVAEQTRVRFSGLGDEVDWTTGGAGSVDLREVDDSPLTCLIGDSGQDIAGRGGLLAFKLTSAYRIHDSTTGAFVTIDPDTGCSGALAACGVPGWRKGGEVTAVLNENGVYLTNGTGKLEKVSGKLDPLFTFAQLSLAGRDSFCSVAKPDGRILFGLRRAGSTENDLTLEYDPSAGWFVPHSFGASAFAVHGLTGQLYHGDPGTGRFLYATFSGGADNGTAITSRFQTRWEHPDPGQAVRVQRIEAFGRGSFSLGLALDHETGPGTAYTFTGMDADLFTWNVDSWNDPDKVWGPGKYEHHMDFWPRKLGHALSFTVAESSSDVSTRPGILGGSAPEVGAWGLYSITAELNAVGLD